MRTRVNGFDKALLIQPAHNGTDTVTFTTGAIDMQRGDGICAALLLGLATAGAATASTSVQIQQSDDTVAGNFSDILGAVVPSLLGSDSVALIGAAKSVTFQRDKRYLRGIGTVAGSGTPSFSGTLTFIEQFKQF